MENKSKGKARKGEDYVADLAFGNLGMDEPLASNTNNPMQSTTDVHNIAY